MTENYTFIEDIIEQLPEIPEDSVVSRTVLDTAEVKATLFGFAAGQEMTEHTAAHPAFIQVLAGAGRMELPGETHSLQTGTWIYMEPRVPHSVLADGQLVFILLLVK